MQSRTYSCRPSALRSVPLVAPLLAILALTAAGCGLLDPPAAVPEDTGTVAPPKDTSGDTGGAADAVADTDTGPELRFEIDIPKLDSGDTDSDSGKADTDGSVLPDVDVITPDAADVIEPVDATDIAAMLGLDRPTSVTELARAAVDANRLIRRWEQEAQAGTITAATLARKRKIVLQLLNLTDAALEAEIDRRMAETAPAANAPTAPNGAPDSTEPATDGDGAKP